MDSFLSLSPEWLVLIGINFFLILLLFFMNLGNRSKIRKLKNKYNRFMNGVSGESMEDLLNECLNKTDRIISKNREIENQINNIDRNLLYCMQKVGVVRYNAFDNVGSDLSFSIALLDSNDNGVVLSGLYSRDSSSTYAKPVIGGKSKYALSVEELKAIDIARKTYRSNSLTKVE